MRLSLFSRLTLGYLTIFLLVTTVSVYAIYQLRHVAARANSVLMVDNQVLDYAEKLRESLLSQSRYEQRFMLSKDEAEYRLFVREKEDFDLQLTNALALGESRIGGILSEIQQHYQNYQELIADEVQLLRAKKVYPQNEYKQNKDTIVSGIVDSLDTLKEDQRQAMNVKVRELAEEADQARRVSFFITSSCLIAIVLLSLLITRSITRPVALLKSKTRDIAEGRFDAGLRISSPPEIAELAVAFNRMCERLGELERMKADFFSSMSHELRTPLTSIKEGTGLLLDGVGG